MRDIWDVNDPGGGDDPPTKKLSTAETTISILHQQSASHLKGVMLSFHLIP